MIILMSALIFSSLGVSVCRHYCMGQVSQQELYLLNHACDKEHDEHHNQPVPEDDCCQEAEFQFRNPEVKLSDEKFLSPLPDANYSASFLIAKPTISSQGLNRYPQKIPYSGRSLLVRFQRFLI